MKGKNAFATPYGLYHFTKMPFGLHRTAVSFQLLMDKTLKGLQDFAVAYIDDILIFSETWEENLEDLVCVLAALHHADLVANRQSVQHSLVRQSVQHLGFNMERRGKV